MGNGDEREFVHLGYERLADHFTAESILENVQKRNDYRDTCARAFDRR